MSDFENKLNEILSNPESLGEIMNIAKSLGLSGDDEVKEAPEKNKKPEIKGDMLGAVTKLAPILSEAGKDDDSTRLLKALKPLLSKPRQEKVDSAVKIIGILRILPKLQENSALSSVFASIF